MKHQDDTEIENENKRLYQLGANELPSKLLDNDILNLAKRQLEEVDISSTSAEKSSHSKTEFAIEQDDAINSTSLTRQIRLYRWPISSAASVLLICGLLLFNGQYKDFYSSETALMMQQDKVIAEEHLLRKRSASANLNSQYLVEREAKSKQALQELDYQKERVVRAKMAAKLAPKNAVAKAEIDSAPLIIADATMEAASQPLSMQSAPVAHKGTTVKKGQSTLIEQVQSDPTITLASEAVVELEYTKAELEEIKHNILAKVMDVDTGINVLSRLIKAKEFSYAELLKQYLLENYVELKMSSHEHHEKFSKLQQQLEQVDEAKRTKPE